MSLRGARANTVCKKATRQSRAIREEFNNGIAASAFLSLREFSLLAMTARIVTGLPRFARNDDVNKKKRSSNLILVLQMNFRDLKILLFTLLI